MGAPSHKHKLFVELELYSCLLAFACPCQQSNSRASLVESQEVDSCPGEPRSPGSLYPSF